MKKLLLGTLITLTISTVAMAAGSFGDEFPFAPKVVADSVAADMAGCYQVSSVGIDYSDDSEHILVKQVLGAKELCVTDTPFSKSGRVTIALIDSNKKMIGSFLGFDVHAGQPRCPQCFRLGAGDGAVNWMGEENSKDETQPIEVKLTISNINTVYNFELY